ncbi:MAG: 2-C-methyl-D-erythritol 2,4-cyclodiphosphate synthase [Coriobacteriales bacterium]|jgi:2-C-methyl-D-erythritol 2,4-cyclodiphosphate synthase|nr:2-C-methyl-D-erythritol 2,4-cyclodiphosphate synthase [Coriobacteriales bacterium]
MHIGFGYDVHALGRGRELVLGGVRIPYPYGLIGHSDADVLSHAVMDAILGAARKGDIGELFPDDDPRYAGADSIELLRSVRALVPGDLDLDCVVVCQQPKLAPYRKAMRERLAEALGMPLQAVGIKATTSEKLGFTGRGEGIAAYAVCLLKNPETRI